MRRLATIAVVALLLGALWWDPAGLLEAERPRNLLLVSLDTLRADRVGAYGHLGARTPRLDGLAREGLLFANATTVVPLTLPAHSSLLTGTFPGYHGVRDNGGFYLGEAHVTLAEALVDAGFETGGFVGSFVLDSRWGIAQGFERYFDDFDLSKYSGVGMDSVQRRGDEVVAAALAWLRESGPDPFFAWVHLYDAHTPYEDAPPEIRARFPRTLRGAYDAEVAWTDSLVGLLIDGLESSGLLRDTMVVVVGDHGESLGDHREQTHGFFIYDGATQVPLIMKGPGIPVRAIKDQVRIVDVMPTVLEALGVAIPAEVQGRSLLPLAQDEPLTLLALSETWYPRYHYGWSELVAIRDGRYKLIRAPRTELYDVLEDPEELRDLSQDRALQVARLSRALDEMSARVERPEASVAPQPMDSETTERLQALGYVGGTTSVRHLEDRPRGDPKDKIDLYNSLKLAGSLSVQERLDEAIRVVEEVLTRDPEIIEGHTLLGKVHSKRGRPEQSVAAYRAALALDPEHQGALFGLAVAYRDLGRHDDAIAGFERARTLDPRNGRVLWQLADTLMRTHDLERAETVLLDAVRLGVDVPRFQVKLGECYLEMGRLDATELALREALRLNPSQRQAAYTLALVHEARGETAKAIEAYERELALDESAFRASFNLGRLLMRGGRLDEAAARFRNATDANPDFSVGFLYLAKVLLDEGELEAAERFARKGLGMSPDPATAPLGHFVLADVFNRRGRSDEAARELAKARRLQKGG